MDKTLTSTDDSADSYAVPAADQSALRAAMRQRCIAEREALAGTPILHREKSMLIQSHLSEWFDQRPPGSFSFCAAIRGEFDAEPLAKHLISVGWRASMAVAVQPAAPLTFRHWAPGVIMQKDRYGIPVPQTEEVANPTVLLIPVVAFDDTGYRLGYGGGFFDRTLAALAEAGQESIAVGIGFALARVNSVVHQPHDQRMDFVVTETGISSLPPRR
jgi:5-formyltetrahydrofolate cyclo-ligase